jgi:hypothetical protein
MYAFYNTNKLGQSLDSIKVGCHAFLPPRFDTAPPIHAFYQEIYNGAYSATGCFIMNFMFCETFKSAVIKITEIQSIISNPQLMAKNPLFVSKYSELQFVI